MNGELFIPAGRQDWARKQRTELVLICALQIVPTDRLVCPVCGIPTHRPDTVTNALKLYFDEGIISTRGRVQ